MLYYTYQYILGKTLVTNNDDIKKVLEIAKLVDNFDCDVNDLLADNNSKEIFVARLKSKYISSELLENVMKLVTDFVPTAQDNLNCSGVALELIDDN